MLNIPRLNTNEYENLYSFIYYSMKYGSCGTRILLMKRQVATA